MSINHNSPEFLFGQILQRFTDNDENMCELRREVSEINKVVQHLPCGHVQDRLGALETWRKRINGKAADKAKAALNFRYAIIIAIVSSFLSAVLAFTVARIMM